MAPMIAAAAIAAAASILSSKMSSDAEKAAAQEYLNAAQKSQDAYKAAYDEAFGEGSYNEKLQGLGVQAAQDYYNLVNNSEAWNKYINGESAYQSPEKFSFTEEDLYSDPSYQFRLQQAQKALEQSQVAGGLNLSGAAAKEMNEYTQNFAAQEYANAYNRNYKQYTDDRTFDYTKWLNESNQYYQNLIQQMNGLNNINNAGINSNNNQTAALQAMAGVNSNTAAQTAAANNMGTNADATFYQNLVNSFGNLGAFAAASSGTTGDNISPLTTSSTGVSTVATGSTPYETVGGYTVPGSGFTQDVNSGWAEILKAYQDNQGKYY